MQNENRKAAVLLLWNSVIRVPKKAKTAPRVLVKVLAKVAMELSPARLDSLGYKNRESMCLMAKCECKPEYLN